MSDHTDWEWIVRDGEINYVGDGVISATVTPSDGYGCRETKYFRLTEVEQTWKEV